MASDNLSRTDRKHLEAKQRIINVAYQLFIVESKFEEVTIREIARLADVSIGFFYLCFENKLSIVSELCRVNFNELIEKIVEELKFKTLGYEQLRIYVNYMSKVTLNKETYRLIQILIQALPLDSEELTVDVLVPIMDKMNKIVTKILIQGKLDGSLHFDEEPQKMAILFSNSMQSFIERTKVDSKLRAMIYGNLTQEDLIDTLIRIFFKVS